MVAKAARRGASGFGISTATMLLGLGPIACGDTRPPASGSGSNSTAGSSPTAATGGANGAGAATAAGGTAASNVGGDAGGPGVISDPSLGDITPLFDAATPLEPAVVEDTPTALITHWADRARDRHAREARYNSYEHYLHIYWEKRTAEIEIVDTVGRGGNSVTFNVKTLWKLDDQQAELRFFFRGVGTAAEYSDNRPMTPVGGVDDFTYTHTVTQNATEGRPLQVGDKMEFELSQFLDKNYQAAEFTGRDNYYGTTMLYVVGKGLVPWAQTGNPCLEPAIIEEPACRDSEPIPETALLGGYTTIHELSSGEPEHVFLQMAGNMSAVNGQKFMLGRRVIHTHFDDGHHDEHAENPSWTEQAGKLGPLFINRACNSCHFANSRAIPTSGALTNYVVKVGDELGNPTAEWGGALQPGGGEPSPSIASFAEEGGLQRPVFAFDGGTPTHFSPRVSPQLVGIGLLEAIPESAILELADPGDANQDGISGRVRKVRDPVNPALTRLGRFGWKAGQASVKYQVAAALRTDMGVLTSIFSAPDCGSAQQDCGPSSPELGDAELDNLTLYISLLAVRNQRDWMKPEVIAGKAVFMEVGCGNCHTPELETSQFAPHAELRSQTIFPYTDLLLHDMGADLADSLLEGEATYQEWRTPPLWGIGYTASTAGEESYLHDGRARTLSEAILWHGGEGEGSKSKFQALSEADQNALLAFLKSL
jgi:CxxC motif-containing protein (DUF1111 family)